MAVLHWLYVISGRAPNWIVGLRSRSRIHIDRSAVLCVPVRAPAAVSQRKGAVPSSVSSKGTIPWAASACKGLAHCAYNPAVRCPIERLSHPVIHLSRSPLGNLPKQGEPCSKTGRAHPIKGGMRDLNCSRQSLTVGHDEPIERLLHHDCPWPGAKLAHCGPCVTRSVRRLSPQRLRRLSPRRLSPPVGPSIYPSIYLPI